MWSDKLIKLCAPVLLLVACQKPVPEIPLENPDKPMADAIIVLGHRPPVDKAGKVTPELSDRLDYGIELFKRGYAPRMVMTGGSSKWGVEAEHMKKYAMERGVPEDVIITEGESEDTIENVRFTRDIVCSSEDQCMNSVIVVSNPYHTRRGAKLLRCAGFKEVFPMPAPMSDRKNKNRNYENRVVFYYWFVDECGRAAGKTGPRTTRTNPH